MEEIIEPFQLVLPTRPPLVNKELENVLPNEMITNHFLVKIELTLKQIFCWSLKITPQIQQDNRKLKRLLIQKASQQIEEKIGKYADSGFEIFSISNISQENNYTIEIIHSDNQLYQLILNLKRVVKIDFKNNSQNERNFAIRFLNAQIKKSFLSLQYHQIGKLPKFFNMNSEPKLEGGYKIFSGFQTSFNYYECGLLLKVDTANKVISKKNVLNLMDQYYSQMQNRSKEDIRQRIRDLLINKVVCSNYGNYSTYKVLDIDFDDKVCNATFPDQKTNEQILITKYFEQKYQIKIQNDQQPLLLSEIEDQKKQKKQVKLVPELMTLTGLMDDVDEGTRRQVLRACNKKPNEKMKACVALVQQITSSDIQQQLMSIGVGVAQQPYGFTGKKLQNPNIKFLGKDLDDNKVSNFQMRTEKFINKINGGGTLKWLMFYQKDGFDKKQFEELFQSNTVNYGFPVDPPVYFELDSKNYSPADQILTQLKQFLRNPGTFDIVLVLVKSRWKNDYSKIKKECTSKYNIPCQWILSENLAKNTGSIIGKILQQLSPKCGGYPWGVKIRDNDIYNQPFILIGAAVTKDKLQKKRTVASIVSSCNIHVTQFFNQCVYQEDGSDIIVDIKEIIKRCLKEYFNISKAPPQRIIYLRDGISNSARNNFNLNELPFILKAPQEIDPNYNPEIAVCLIDRKPTQKFYVQKDNITKNPQHGSVIDSHVINDRNEYEFKMIPQVVGDNLGCATPTQYTFVHHSTTLTQTQMQNLIYAQCFNYSNWNGPIRVPSVVQYAIKAGDMVANNIHQSVLNTQLNSVLWFL